MEAVKRITKNNLTKAENYNLYCGNSYEANSSTNHIFFISNSLFSS